MTTITPETRRWHYPCLAMTAWLASCYSTATLHTARPVAPGETQTGIAIGSFVGEDDGDASALPTIEGQVRYGLKDRLDVGVHITNLGTLALDANYAILMTEDQAVSIDPTVEFSFGTYAWLPVLWDFYRSETMTLTAAARGGRYWLDLDEDEDFLLDELEADAWLYGGGLAGRIKLTESLDLAPELRVIWVDSDDTSLRSPLVSFSLGLIF